MASAKATFLLMLCLIIAIGNIQCQCGTNEVFKSCGTCDGTCKNPNPICAQSCTMGCFCQENYVRNDEHKCVKSGGC